MRNAVMAAAAAAAEAGFYNNNSCNGGGGGGSDRTRLFAGGGKGPQGPQAGAQNSSKPVREWYVWSVNRVIG